MEKCTVKLYCRETLKIVTNHATDVIERIWRGERDDANVMDGVDAASGLALSAIVRHARNFDRAYGKPAAPRVNFYPGPPSSRDDGG